VHALCTEQDMAVLWATHLVDEVWPEDDLVILHEGRVRELGPVSEVLARCGAPDVFSAFTRLTQSGGGPSDQGEADRP
jgi:ABC-2 type transport system ATP-binding protein